MRQESKPVRQSELGRLHDLAMFLRAEKNLRTHLAELVTRAASVTDAASCSVCETEFFMSN